MEGKKACREQFAEEKKKKLTTRMGFEPTRAEHNGLAVHRLNHSATSSTDKWKLKYILWVRRRSDC